MNFQAFDSTEPANQRAESGQKSQVSGLSSPLTPPSHASLVVIGLDSMIGSALAREAEARGIPCQGTSRRPGARWHLDLAAPPESWQLPENASTAILCAAVTNLDVCEKNPELTFAINTRATIALADRLAESGIGLIFLSTSRVFSPEFETPCESTPPAPCTEYGRQKLAVERHLQLHHPTAKILRPAKIISPSLPLFDLWRRDLSDKKPFHAYSDLFLSPVSLQQVIDSILTLTGSSQGGIFHLSATDAISYFDVACFLAEIERADPSLIQRAPAPQPNTPGSAILLCSKILTRPSQSFDNLKVAFSRKTDRATPPEFHPALQHSVIVKPNQTRMPFSR